MLSCKPFRLSLRSCLGIAVIVAAFIVAATRQSETVIAADEQATDAAAAKEALAAFNSLIGEWRGVGLPRRGSRDGAWTETGEWVWEFTDGTPGIRYDVTDGKLLDSALLTWNADDQSYRLAAQFEDATERTYTGKPDGNKLVLETAPDDAEDIYRITITQLNAKRTLVLYEKRRATTRTGTRLAEVGYTREGTSLAIAGEGEPECIVTGGRGTIKISFEGETYYVCCTGCQQAFDDDPAGTIAEYKQKVKERMKKRAQKDE